MKKIRNIIGTLSFVAFSGDKLVKIKVLKLYCANLSYISMKAIATQII